MNFCIRCQNRLETSTSSNVIIHECFACKEIYPSSPKDELMYKREYKTKGDEDQIYTSKILKNTPYADDTIKSDKTCPKCDQKYVKYIVSGDNMIRYFICKCGYFWTT